MQKRSLKEWIARLLILLVGLTIAHFGITLFLLSALGSDPFTIFIQGLSMTFGLTIGTCHVIILCLLIVIFFFTTKGYIKPGSFVCAFCGGPIIDFFLWLMGDSISAQSSMSVRILAAVAGCIILAFGMSIVIKSDAGTGPNDLVAVILTDKLRRFQFRWVRMAVDVFFAVVGLALGGVIGLGTVFAVLLVGPAAQFFFPFDERMISRLISRV